MTAATDLSFCEKDFRKAAASNPDKDCVRVARRGSRVELRDDKNAFGTAEDVRLVFTDAEFDVILAALRAGSAEGTCLEITQDDAGMYRFRRARGAAVLVFTSSEVNKFLIGVNAQEFDMAAYAA
jgi:hypothetical protein